MASSPRAIDPEARFLPHQRAVFKSTARHVVYVKGRRAGGTYGAVLRLVQLARQAPPTRHLWVDTVQRNIARYVRRYFAPLLRGSRWHWDARAGVLTFAGGSTCDFGSAQRPERIEGFGYRYIWINEAGHLLRDESLYYETLLPMVMESPQAQMFLIGAPKGRGLFERMYRWGQDPAMADWVSFRHPSHVNPAVDAAWLERMRGQMPERVWRQEILAEFIAEADAVFRDLDAVATAQPESAPAPTESYVIGVDLGRYQDYTAAWVVRGDGTGGGVGVHCERYQNAAWPVQQARLAALARRYGDALLVVDASGPGDPLCDALEAEGLAVQRVRFTAQSKRHLVDGLAIALERGLLSLVPHEATLRELRDFRYEYTAAGNVRTGGYREHDDCVIALALCAWGLARRGGGGFILGAPMGTRELD